MDMNLKQSKINMVLLYDKDTGKVIRRNIDDIKLHLGSTDLEIKLLEHLTELYDEIDYLRSSLGTNKSIDEENLS